MLSCNRILSLIAVSAALISCMATDPSAILFTGDTSKPVHSTYILGEHPAVNFTISGLRSGERQTLRLNIVDEFDRSRESMSIRFTADADGSWYSGDIAVNGEKLGFYRVLARLDNGAMLNRIGSREEGFLTFAVVPDPARRQVFPAAETLFGMPGGFGPWADEVLELLGASWVLDGEFDWIKLEPDMAGTFRSDDYHHVEPPRDWPLYPLPTFGMMPLWAVVPETFAYNTGRLTPEGEIAWDAFVRQAVRAFMKKWPGFSPRYYQITWEPIQPWGFRGTDRDLVRIYEIAHRAVRQTDPEGLVAGPCRGIDKGEVQRLEDLLQLGLGNYIDAYAVHPYWAGAHPEIEGMHENLASIRDLLHRYTGRDIPMIGTEQGMTTQEDPAMDLIQARSLIRQNLITLGEGYAFNMAFYIVDYWLAGQKGYGYYYVPLDGVPWGPEKINPRPIVPAYAAQSLLIEGHRTLGRIGGLGPTSLGYTFIRGDNIVLALWDYGEGRKNITLPVGMEEVELFDWMGNRTILATPGGIAELELSAEPVYIRGVSPLLWGDTVNRLLRLPEHIIDVIDSDSAQLTVTIDRSGDYRLVIEPDPSLGTAAIHQEASGTQYTIAVPVPPEARAGMYPVRIMLVRDDSVVGYEGAVLRIFPPVAITAVAGSGAQVLSLTLSNTAAVRHNGEITAVLQKMLRGEPRPDLPMIDLPDGKVQLVDVEGGMIVQTWECDPFTSQEIRLVFDNVLIDPYSPYLATIEVNSFGARGSVQAETVSFAVLSRPKIPVVIDGDLSEWDNVPSSTVSGLSYVIRNPRLYTGPDDLSAVIRMQWDDTYLYLAIEVTDDIISADDSGDLLWRNDCIQWAVNVAGPGESPKNTETNIGFTPGGIQAFRAISFDSERVPLGELGYPDINFMVVRTPTGLVYEAAYSWDSLGLDTAPQAGHAIGLAFAVNDRDSVEQTDPKALGIFGGIYPTKDSDAYGIFLLED